MPGRKVRNLRSRKVRKVRKSNSRRSRSSRRVRKSRRVRSTKRSSKSRRRRVSRKMRGGAKTLGKIVKAPYRGIKWLGSKFVSRPSVSRPSVSRPSVNKLFGAEDINLEEKGTLSPLKFLKILCDIVGNIPEDMWEEGVFRVPTHAKSIKLAKDEINNYDWSSCIDKDNCVDDVLTSVEKIFKANAKRDTTQTDYAILIKEFLRDLDTPIFNPVLTEQILMLDLPEQYSNFENIAQTSLKPNEKKALKIICKLMDKISKVQKTKMTLSSLALILSPNLLKDDGKIPSIEKMKKATDIITYLFSNHNKPGRPLYGVDTSDVVFSSGGESGENNYSTIDDVLTEERTYLSEKPTKEIGMERANPTDMYQTTNREEGEPIYGYPDNLFGPDGWTTKQTIAEEAEKKAYRKEGHPPSLNSIYSTVNKGQNGTGGPNARAERLYRPKLPDRRPGPAHHALVGMEQESSA
jgi:hypothetical protein